MFKNIYSYNNFIRKAVVACSCMIIGLDAKTQTGNLAISENAKSSSFALVNDKMAATIYYDAADAKVVHIAVEAFSKDIQLVTGKEMRVTPGQEITGDYIIVAGTISHSFFIDRLIQSKKINVAAIQGKWESFSISVIDQPLPGTSKALVIAGSDRRGTAYGIFYLSRLIGVSPFVWWADVVPAHKEQLFISGSYTSKVPSVKYRGIFINDEDWGMQPWAAKDMDTDIKDIGPKTYAKVFELLLRLKANYTWPAMHPCTKAFYYYKDNPKVADDYAIVVGGSHCEPMLRNNVCEWAETYEEEYGKKPGEWRYDVNKDEIYKYWDDRVKESINYESVFTVGMRGVHDGSMPGPKDPDEKKKLLENVITDQRTILTTNFKKPVAAIPQIFVPYKEVLSLYRRNMRLPGDVTIIWPDDNFGYIRQLPNEEEQKRSGGHGVYYHLSYWGSPQDYLWLSSISPSLISYEMSKAYNYGADKLWVFNVGDIKPAEMELQFAMDMAWDIKKYDPITAAEYNGRWAAETFGTSNASSIAGIKKEYYELAQAAKPEHLGMVLFSKNEMNKRLARYQAIASKAIALQKIIPARLQDAYFELVLYPVLCSKLMNEKIFYLRQSENAKATIAFDSIRLLTQQYNTTVANGKWNGMMSYHPRDLKIFNAPVSTDSLKLLKDTLAKDDPVLVLDASNFTTKHEPAAMKFTAMEIGINGRGLTVLPADSKQWKNNDTFTDVFTSYAVNLPAGKYVIMVKCLPTFAMGKTRQLRYGIALDNETAQVVNVNAEAETPVWKLNVVNGFSYGRTIHTINSNGKTELKLWFKDANLVINTIEIYKAQ